MHSRMCYRLSWAKLSWYAYSSYIAKHTDRVTKFFWCNYHTCCCRFELGSMRSLVCWLTHAPDLIQVVVAGFCVLPRLFRYLLYGLFVLLVYSVRLLVDLAGILTGLAIRLHGVAVRLTAWQLAQDS